MSATPTTPTRERVVLPIQGMTCASCATRVEGRLNDLEGVEATVNYATERATVDYAYRSQYLVTVGEQDKWATAADRNRLSMRMEDGRWRIVSGM